MARSLDVHSPPNTARNTHMNSGIYLWHEAYTAATLETDPCRKRERIDEAIDAIQQRLHDDTAPLDRAERVAIMDARLELDEMKKGAGG